MRIDILTCLPELLVSPFAHSIVKRAQDKGLAEIHVHDLRAHAINKHGQIDDYVFGGGAGMVLRVEPIAAWLDALQAERRYDAVIFLTPDGETLRQPLANRLSLLGNIIMLCGHYKGIDERIRQTYITHEISVGDYVLSGGEHRVPEPARVAVPRTGTVNDTPDDPELAFMPSTNRASASGPVLESTVRAPAPLRLVRRGDRALRRSGQRGHRLRPHEARCADPSGNEGRSPDYRRRHGKYIFVGTRCRCRQVSVRA